MTEHLSEAKIVLKRHFDINRVPVAESFYVIGPKRTTYQAAEADLVALTEALKGKTPDDTRADAWEQAAMTYGVWIQHWYNCPKCFDACNPYSIEAHCVSGIPIGEAARRAAKAATELGKPS